MAIATFGRSFVGPSSIPSERVADFEEDSDDAEYGRAGPSSPKRLNGSQSTVGNGTSQKSGRQKLVNGPAGSQGSNGHAAAAKSRRLERAENLLKTRQELPFCQARRGILEEIMNHETTVIIGETGCGKSTQLPQFLRTHSLSRTHYSPSDPDAPPWKRGPNIAITQPRRLATISLANRVAEEMGCVVGGEVGYTVRFEDVTGRQTKIRYMTEGVLMRELANGDRPEHRHAQANGHFNGPIKEEYVKEEEKPVIKFDALESSSAGGHGLNLLLKYDIIIIDEAHERTLNTDFLCGTLKKIQQRRKQLVEEQRSVKQDISNDLKGKRKEEEAGVKELKIVIMSATLDPGKFQRFFETGRDTLLVKGRMYNVLTRHTLKPINDYIEAALKNVLAIHKSKSALGDILVFMPGSDDIERCCDQLRRLSEELPEDEMKLQPLPLYSALPPGAQSKIFAPAPANTRRVIVATNIAETSITIPGISYVIDTGYKKEKDYIFRSSGAIEHLARKPISQAAAWQRTGRAGRERSGECYRLYTADKFNTLNPFDAPEIQRTNLASAVLQLLAMQLDPMTFEFIDNPGRDPLLAAVQTLGGLNAIQSPLRITPLGRSMLFYPLDPTHARILLASFDLGCPSEIIDILSLLVSGPIWIDKSSEQDAQKSARLKFLHREGDHLTGLNVFRAYIALREQQSAFGKWCKDNYVNSRTLAAAIKVRDQLRDLASRDGRKWNVSCGSETSLVMRSLLMGMFMNTAVIQADGTYKQTTGNLTVKIHPSSVLMSKKVPGILYDELALTTGMYARGVSTFEQQWLYEVPLFRQAGLTVAEPVVPTTKL